MSWGISFECARGHERASLNNALAEARGKGPSFSAQYDPPEVMEQVSAAIAAVRAITDSDSVGAGVTFRVRLSGRANPGHLPRDSWANDYITVTVEQAAGP